MEQTIQLSKKDKLKKFNQKLNLMLKSKVKQKCLEEKQQTKIGECSQNKQGQENTKKEPTKTDCLIQKEKLNQSNQIEQHCLLEKKQDSKTKKIKKDEKDHSNYKNQKASVCLRKAAGQVWQDKSMLDWPENGYRIFCGNLGNQVSDQILSNVFRNRYNSFQMGKVIRDKRTGKSKGYGFISFAQPKDFLNALKQMNGKYVGNRPVKLTKSNWKDRQLNSEQNQMLPSDFKVNSGKQTNKICVNYKYTSSF